MWCNKEVINTNSQKALNKPLSQTINLLSSFSKTWVFVSLLFFNINCNEGLEQNIKI